jgi:hypothetical protein
MHSWNADTHAQLSTHEAYLLICWDGADKVNDIVVCGFFISYVLIVGYVFTSSYVSTSSLLSPPLSLAPLSVWE